MAAQANLASVKSNKRQRATNSQKRSSIKKSTPTQRAGSRSSERLRNKQLASYVQVPSCLTPISRPALTKRKRSQDLEAEDEADQPKGVRPLKQLRRLLPSPGLLNHLPPLLHPSLRQPAVIETLKLKSTSQRTSVLQNSPEKVLLPVSSPLRRTCQKTSKLELKPISSEAPQNSPENPLRSLRTIHNHYNHSTRK